MNNYQRNIIFSSALFGGFTINLDIRFFDDKYDIINHCISELKTKLQENNFQELIYKLDKIKFHIHTHTFEEILLNNDNTSIYICDCNDH